MLGGCDGPPATGAYLQATQEECSRRSIRESTYSGRPRGSPDFTAILGRQEPGDKEIGGRHTYPRTVHHKLREGIRNQITFRCLLE